MQTCNLFEIVHNIWFQQSRNMATCFFVATSNDYVQTFRQSSLYYAFLQGCASRIKLNKDELHLRKIS
jgi:hypothetical protein